MTSLIWTSTHDGASIVTGLSLILLFLLAGFVIYLFYLIQGYKDQISRFEAEISSQKQMIGALCASAVGVDRRVNRIEQHGRDLEERQGSIENKTHHPDPPYADAIQRVKAGADADALVTELGISHAAADLIILMHGIKQKSAVGDQ